ncbi:MAG: type II toxin-antitoxin system RelE/ParE family toxin [Trueperaceae bacterium]|nr:type II toxin-antitoxin system RelE/ParE family toxin [Trueperaceae bacterium]
MIQSFRDAGIRDVFDGVDSRAARATCPQDLWPVARRKLDYLARASELRDLRAPPGNRLESLKGDRQGQYAIRINAQYRICFVWTTEGARNVEITDYHAS